MVLYESVCISELLWRVHKESSLHLSIHPLIYLFIQWVSWAVCGENAPAEDTNTEPSYAFVKQTGRPNATTDQNNDQTGGKKGLISSLNRKTGFKGQTRVFFITETSLACYLRKRADFRFFSPCGHQAVRNTSSQWHIREKKSHFNAFVWISAPAVHQNSATNDKLLKIYIYT